MKKHFYDSIQLGELDSRLEENELIIGINEECALLAVPRVEIWKEDFAVNLTLSGRPVAVLCLPGTHTLGAYQRQVGDQILSLERSGGHFLDNRTGSIWNIEGRCIEGRFQGECLQPLNFVSLEWHAWVTYHPDTEIFTSASPAAVLPSEDPVLDAVCRELARNGHLTDLQWPVLKVWLPEGARSGMEIRVGGYPVRLFHFQGSVQGADWASCHRHSAASGCLAAASFPRRLYSDIAHQVRLPDGEVEWAPIIESGEMGEILAACHEACTAAHPALFSFGRFVKSVEENGFQVGQKRYLLGAEVAPPAQEGYALRIGKDRWQLFRFPSADLAREEALRRGHSIQAGPLLLWSDPPGMYGNWLTHTRPEDQVDWASGLKDESFRRLMTRLLEAGDTG